MTKDLIRLVTPENIQTAIFDIMCSMFFLAIFYHQYWNELKPEINDEVIELVEEGTLD